MERRTLIWMLRGGIIGVLIWLFTILQTVSNTSSKMTTMIFIASIPLLFVGIFIGAISGYTIGKIKSLHSRYFFIIAVLGGLWGLVGIIINIIIHLYFKDITSGILVILITLPRLISLLTFAVYSPLLMFLAYTPIPALIISFHFYILPIIIGSIFGLLVGYSIEYLHKFKKQ